MYVCTYKSVYIHTHVCLRLWGVCLILNIVLGGWINVLSNKSIMMSGFTLWSVLVMILSLKVCSHYESNVHWRRINS